MQKPKEMAVKNTGHSWRQLESGDDVNKAWREVVATCGYATFFHTKEWADIICLAFPQWQPDPVAFEFTDGNLAILPMLRRVDCKARRSMAPEIYGGPLFLRFPTEAQMAEIGKVPRWYSDILLFDNPFSPYPWEQEGLIRWRVDTHVLDLSPGFDKVFAGCRYTIRQQYRKAERAGITVSVAQNLSQVDEYYEVYLDARHRWGDKSQIYLPRSLFHDLFRLQEEGRGVRFWLAYLDSRVVSGAVMLYHEDIATGFHHVTVFDHLRSGVSSLVYMFTARAACAEGLRLYDFGQSPNRGVKFFKESFRAQRHRFNIYHSPVFTPWSQ
jgi:hypothetical protein